ncbi:dihydroorotate dehydrogenase electron transfer subunit [Deferrisoma camini]|uniref:dihydroorotate dehydrogenase electron transfer subunit n=1 Tax=Deferrisoma camini TaxID=1035120 RepID=UPI00046CE7C4|nr:dihydroorotate dehydrogenase electron transfer subunit [Deferrisoma camini]
MDDRAWVVYREALGGEYYRLRLRPAEPFGAEPGQFVMLQVGEGIDPLLRRPFSIHRMDPLTGGEFEVLFRVAGRGTSLLARRHVGDRVDVLGPLGRGFTLDAEAPVLVGGGVGVAPLLFLAEAFLDRGVRPRLVLGARSDRDLLCHGDFACLSVPCELVTEDGSLGRTGLVTTPLEHALREAGGAARVYACGPMPMLRAVADLCARHGVGCEVSLEAHMACGVGACLGCVVPAAGGGYLRVCKDGPVFRGEQIAWNAEVG